MPQPAPTSCFSVQQLPTFQLIYWSSACEDVNHLSFAARSQPRSARSNRYHQSLSLPFDRKYVHCVRGEDEGEAKREIIKQISSSSGAGGEEQEEGEADWPAVIKNRSPNQTGNEHKFVISCLHSTLALINSLHQPSASAQGLAGEEGPDR